MSGRRSEEATTVAVDFLKELRPAGPWVLTAIVPDGPVRTFTAMDENEALKFINANVSKANLYYSVNPTRTALKSKAKKVDIASVEYMLADLDPKDGEAPEAAKTRYLAAIEAREPKPTGIIDSGNGIQVLWRLAVPIALPEPVAVKGKRHFPPEAAALIDEIEGRSAAMMVALGSIAGTQNIDRILRLPGTINFPNKTKLKAGRVECPTKLMKFNGATSSLDDFPEPVDEGPSDAGDETQAYDNDLDDIIVNGCGKRFDGDRSRAVWHVINTMLRRGYRSSAIETKLLDRSNKISDHVYDQPAPQSYAKRQVAEAIKKIDFSRDKSDAPYNSPGNIRIALLKLGVHVAYDIFAYRTMISGLPDFGPVLADAGANRLWLTLDDRFRFRPSKELFFTVVLDTARLNSFHPVCDYLKGLSWDGVPRIDSGWLITLVRRIPSSSARSARCS